jgi:3-oxoacyl-[acyl-carrier protein] reductase
MTDSLHGKAVLVTGATRGIGRDVARHLARLGAEVIVAGRDAGAADRVVAEIREDGGLGRGVVLDVSSDESVARASKELLNAYASIPLLVNNAGITRDGLLVRMKRDDWDAVIDTNLTGAYRTCRAFVPAMMRARYGRIVNISSVVAEMGNPGQGNYAASKSGLEGFTRSLGKELASRNITVNCVAPGFIETDMTRDLADDVRERLLQQVPAGRLGTGMDVAAAVAFLLGDGAAYVTGATLAVNGGMYM